MTIPSAQSVSAQISSVNANPADLSSKTAPQAAKPNLSNPAAGNSHHARAKLSGVRAVLVLLSLFVAMFLSLLAGTIAFATVPVIAVEFADHNTVSWVVSAYLLTLAVTCPICTRSVLRLSINSPASPVAVGKFSDLTGRRFMVVTSMLLFALGSILSGAAPNLRFQRTGSARISLLFLLSSAR